MTRKWQQPKPIMEVLKATLDKLKLTPILKRHEVFENWAAIAGPQIAERSRPIKIQGGILIIEVDHPTWVQELNFLKPRLLEKIAKHYPESRIKNLRFLLR